MIETIDIYVVDPTHDNPGYYHDLDEQASSKRFKEELSNKISIEQEKNDFPNASIKEVNIGAGADWPAIVINILPSKEVLPFAVLFFSGKLINENLDAWLSIGEKIGRLFGNVVIYGNRFAAFLIGLHKYDETKSIKSIRLLEYQAIDGRFEEDWKNIHLQSMDIINCSPSEEWIGSSIHYFRVEINGTEVRFLIYGSEVNIKPQPTSIEQ